MHGRIFTVRNARQTLDVSREFDVTGAAADFGDHTSFRPVTRAKALATATEWLIWAGSFRWSAVSKKSLRG
jgi:hypothetical protein